MSAILGTCVVLALIAFVIWGLIPSKNAGQDATAVSEDSLIDPTDSYQIGLLTGMMGGDIADAAVIRFALQRFEEMHGRKATVRDLGIVAGLMKSSF